MDNILLEDKLRDFFKDINCDEKKRDILTHSNFDITTYFNPIILFESYLHLFEKNFLTLNKKSQIELVEILIQDKLFESKSKQLELEILLKKSGFDFEFEIKKKYIEEISNNLLKERETDLKKIDWEIKFNVLVKQEQKGKLAIVGEDSTLHKIVLDYLEEKSFVDNYWKLGYVDLLLGKSTDSSLEYTINCANNKLNVKARILNGAFLFINQTCEIIQDNSKLEDLILSGEHKDISIGIRNLLEASKVDNLFELREKTKPIEYSCNFDELEFNIGNENFYFFSEKIPILINDSKNLPSKYILPIYKGVYNSNSKEVLINSLLEQKYLSWNKKNIEEELAQIKKEYFEGQIYLENRNLIQRLRFMLLSSRVKEIFYLIEELDKGLIPPIICCKNDVNLIDINVRSNLFMSMYKNYN